MSDAIVYRVCLALAALILLSVLLASLQSQGARHLHRGSAVGVPLGARGYVSARALDGGWGCGQSGIVHPASAASYGRVVFGRGGALPSPDISEHFATILEGVSGIDHVARVTGGLYRGAAPSARGVLSLHQLGVRTVIDLRSRDRAEERRVTVHGMRYEWVPVRATSAPDEASVARYFEILGDASAYPIFVHCVHGVDRTGMMMALFRIRMQGWRNIDALAEMQHFVAGYRLRDFVIPQLRDFVMGYRRGPGARPPPACANASGITRELDGGQAAPRARGLYEEPPSAAELRAMLARDCEGLLSAAGSAAGLLHRLTVGCATGLGARVGGSSWRLWHCARWCSAQTLNGLGRHAPYIGHELAHDLGRPTPQDRGAATPAQECHGLCSRLQTAQRALGDQRRRALDAGWSSLAEAKQQRRNLWLSLPAPRRRRLARRLESLRAGSWGRHDGLALAAGALCCTLSLLVLASALRGAARLAAPPCAEPPAGGARTSHGRRSGRATRVADAAHGVASSRAGRPPRAVRAAGGTGRRRTRRERMERCHSWPACAFEAHQLVAEAVGAPRRAFPPFIVFGLDDGPPTLRGGPPPPPPPPRLAGGSASPPGGLGAGAELDWAQHCLMAADEWLPEIKPLLQEEGPRGAPPCAKRRPSSESTRMPSTSVGRSVDPFGGAPSRSRPPGPAGRGAAAPIWLPGGCLLPGPAEGPRAAAAREPARPDGPTVCPAAEVVPPPEQALREAEALLAAALEARPDKEPPARPVADLGPSPLQEQALREAESLLDLWLGNAAGG